MSLVLSVESPPGPEDRSPLAKAVSRPGDEVVLVYDAEYGENDTLVVSSSVLPCHAVLQLDDALPPALVYLAESPLRYTVPTASRKVYSPRAFAGTRHVLTARTGRPEEVAAYRNLAFNPYDQPARTGLYPHASANVETRGEAVFAARNAIDGNLADGGHGEWPFTSWGINRDPEARIEIDFGRDVRIDRAVFYLRADFPHDAWWESATLRFSDGSSLTVPLTKKAGAQTISFESRSVRWAAVDTLIKADDPSPFPALTQLQLFGTEN